MKSPSDLMYLLWVQKMARHDRTTVNRKGWEVLQDGWQELENGLEKSFFARLPEHTVEYKQYKKDARRKWGAVFEAECFRQQVFIEFVMSKYSLTWDEFDV